VYRVVIIEGEGAFLRVNLGRPIVTNGYGDASMGMATHSSQITLGGLFWSQ